MSEIDYENVEYINKKVNPILEKLVIDILTKRPEDVVNFFT